MISSFSYIPGFCSIFTLNRFQHLMDSLNLANNENSNCKELGILPSKSHKYYIPKQEFAIDEQMMGTKYWVSFIQFMPQKPCQLKRIWALCSAFPNIQNQRRECRTRTCPSCCDGLDGEIPTPKLPSLHG